MAILGFLAGVVWWVTRPASPETLYADAKKLMESGDPADHEKAYTEPIADYRKYYASREGAETGQILAWKKQVEFERSEERLNKLLHGKIKLEPANDAEKDALPPPRTKRRAIWRTPKQSWQKMTQKYDAASGYEEWGVWRTNI